MPIRYHGSDARHVGRASIGRGVAEPSELLATFDALLHASPAPELRRRESLWRSAPASLPRNSLNNGCGEVACGSLRWRR
jgi:hypothetical protein